MTGARLTPATIRYLFADRWEGRDDSNWGVRVPAGVKVPGLSLAANLLTIALWSLSEQDLAQVRQVGPLEERKLLGRFEVTVLGGKSATRITVVDPNAQRGGLEGVLLAAAKDTEEVELRRHVLNLGLSSGSPWSSVANCCRDEAVAAGIVRIEGKLRRRPVISDAGALVALEPRDAEIAAARGAYRENNPDLDDAVFHDCAKAIDWAHQSGPD